MAQDSADGQWQRPRDAEHTIVWLDDGHRAPRRKVSAPRRVIGLVAAVVCVAIVGVPVGLALTSARSGTAVGHKLTPGPAEHRVLSALSATTAAGSFDIAYHLTESPAAVPSATTTTCFSGVYSAPTTVSGGPTRVTVYSCGGNSGPHDVSVTGHGTIDVNPLAMAVSADVSNFGAVSVRVNATDVWELGGGDYGLAPNSNDSGPGSPLSGFAGLVEGTLGSREGALAMLGMASPNGFLDLSQQAITGAAEVGTGSVGDTAVTEYEVSLDPSQLAQGSGTSADESKAIHDAVALMNQNGYTGTMVKVAIDGAGYIREVTPVASFADGGKVTLDAVLSNLGCAGTVLMPGQPAPTTTTTPCVPPDTTTTTSPASPSTTPSTTTTVPSSTTTAPSTTTTTPSTTASSTATSTSAP